MNESFGDHVMLLYTLFFIWQTADNVEDSWGLISQGLWETAAIGPITPHPLMDKEREQEMRTYHDESLGHRGHLLPQHGRPFWLIQQMSLSPVLKMVLCFSEKLSGLHMNAKL